RRPTVGDLRAVMHIENEAEQGLMLVSRVTGLVPEDLDELDLKDLEALQATFRTEEEAV
ncbi:phage tail assembly protein, partial [Kingella kingae]|uniref:phage tail assembly protein n=1 Tax=Kingella kingae TaxID=504 RepID=UPI0018AD3EFF